MRAACVSDSSVHWLRVMPLQPKTSQCGNSAGGSKQTHAQLGVAGSEPMVPGVRVSCVQTRAARLNRWRKATAVAHPKQIDADTDRRPEKTKYRQTPFGHTCHVMLMWLGAVSECPALPRLPESVSATRFAAQLPASRRNRRTRSASII